ncbi:MAG: flagellar hook protein FliD [Rhodobacteraceae bacterium PARR1]|nr:MAG: flagellar hook protein FliD [Rhodobacteraceae bacterium PARR1]
MVDILSTLNKNGSGLNLSDLTTSLVAAEIQPRQRAEQKKLDSANLSISTLGQVRAQFQSLQTAVTNLQAAPILKASSGNSGVKVTITDPSKIANSSRSIGVVQTAQRQVLEFKGFTSADQTIGAGALKVEIGAWFKDASNNPAFALNPESTVNTLNIPAGATLSQLAETLDVLPGLSARVIDKGDGTFSLGIVSEAGAGNALRFTATETAAGLSIFDTTATNATAQIQAAQDAVLELDGITVTRPTNSIDDLIDGATLDISAPAGTQTTVDFRRDMETARTNLQYLVDQVNSTLSKLTEVSARAANGASSGVLAGDRVVEKLKSDLRNMIAGPLTGFGQDPVFLSDLGVQSQRDGSLRLNSYDFEKAFATSPAKFDAAFNDRLSSTSDGVEVTGLLSSTAPSASLTLTRDMATGKAKLGDHNTIGFSPETGRMRYTVLDGPYSGLMIDMPDTADQANVTVGRSFLSRLDGLLTDALQSGGRIAERESQIGARVTAANTEMGKLDDRAAKLTTRYLSKFTQMETTISTLKSTGNYLTNLVAQWNKSS